jgi:hypothetical protein
MIPAGTRPPRLDRLARRLLKRARPMIALPHRVHRKRGLLKNIPPRLLIQAAITI